MAIPRHIIIWIVRGTNFPGFDWKYNCFFPMCCFPELTLKFADCLDGHGLVFITYNQSFVGVIINVLDLFITKKV